jgi:tRNA pseudouridine55 synthase
VKRQFKGLKIGHGGTLDPLATGVLPIAIGEATKTVSYVMDHIKTYAFTICFGERRSTDDGEGEVVETSDHRPTQDDILAILPQFIGDIQQIPPIYSALKVDGIPHYKRARQGEVIEIAPRTVHVETLTLQNMDDGDHATFHVVCGKGTYVRSLCRDIAASLGTVGYVSMLRRLTVGKFSIDHAISLDYLVQVGHKEDVYSSMRSICSVLDDIPAVTVGDMHEVHLRQGKAIPCLEKLEDQDVLCLSSSGLPIALAISSDGLLQPKRVFNLF